MNEINVGMAGLFKIDLYNDKGELVQAGEWQKNLVLNQGIDIMFTDPQSYMVAVGTNDTPVAATDTELAVINYARPVLTKSATYWDKANNELYVFQISNTRIHNNTGADKTIKEVGFVGRYRGAKPLAMTRALVAPEISFPSNWYIDVTYEIRQYLPTEVTAGTLEVDTDGVKKTFNTKHRLMDTRLVPNAESPTIGYNSLFAFTDSNGTDFSHHGRLTSVQIFAGYAANDELNTGVASSIKRASVSGATYASYLNGSYYLENTFTVPAETVLEGNQIKSLTCNYKIGYFHVSFDDGAGNGIEKTNSQELKFTFRYIIRPFTGVVRSRP